MHDAMPAPAPPERAAQDPRHHPAEHAPVAMVEEADLVAHDLESRQQIPSFIGVVDPAVRIVGPVGVAAQPFPLGGEAALEMDLTMPLELGAREPEPLEQGDHSGETQQPQPQLAQELDLEPVVDGCPVVEHEEELAARLEHPVNLGDGAADFGNVLQHTEGIHRVETAVREIERSGVALQGNPGMLNTRSARSVASAEPRSTLMPV